MALEELLSVEEVAAWLKVSHWTVRGWLSKGKLPRSKAGRRVLIAKTDVDKFLRQGSAGPEPDFVRPAA